MEQINFDISKEEVLRYLGYGSQDMSEELSIMIDDCCQLVKKHTSPRYVYSFFDISFFDYGINVTNTNLFLLGKGIAHHLKNCKKCVLMAVTLGPQIEKLIMQTMPKSPTKAVIMDACATAATESICDVLENKIRAMFKLKGDDITDRFSPGYSDFPLQTQPLLLSVLDTQKRIGLTVTHDNILIPRKSVTAVMGILEKATYTRRKVCTGCDKYDACAYRKEGKICGV